RSSRRRAASRIPRATIRLMRVRTSGRNRSSRKGTDVGKFKIEVHDRLQEWVAEEKGYFRDEGLDYEFVMHKRDAALAPLLAANAREIARGATEFLVEGQGSSVSCACQWAVDIAASSGHGKVWPKAYMVTPGAVFVRPESSAAKIEDLAGVEIAVGHRS